MPSLRILLAFLGCLLVHQAYLFEISNDPVDQDNIYPMVPPAKECTNSDRDECGNYQICLQNKCHCLFGYSYSPANGDCTIFQCTINEQCRRSYGVLSGCSQITSNCLCPTGHPFVVSSQKCKAYDTPACSQKDGVLTCPEWSGQTSCSTQGHCQCKFGSIEMVQGADEHVHCEQFKCTDDQDCRQLFGQWTTCSRNGSAIGTCGCPPETVADDHQQRCLKVITDLSSPTNGDEDENDHKILDVPRWAWLLVCLLVVVAVLMARYGCYLCAKSNQDG